MTIPQCEATVSEPPYHIHNHQCEKRGKHTRFDRALCGTHVKIIDDYDDGARFAKLHWGWQPRDPEWEKHGRVRWVRGNGAVIEMRDGATGYVDQAYIGDFPTVALAQASVDAMMQEKQVQQAIATHIPDDPYAGLPGE